MSNRNCGLCESCPNRKQHRHGLPRRGDAAVSLRRRRYLTVPEAAELTGLKADTIRVRIRRGEVKARDLAAGTGRRPRWRIPTREVRRLIATERREDA